MANKFMKKTLFIMMAFVLLALGCNKAVAPTTNNNLANFQVPPSNQINSNNNSPAPALQTYSNSSYNFEFQYPPEFSFTDPSYANLEHKIVQVGLARSEYPGTNFDDAALSVSNGFSASLKECLSKDLPENAKGFQETRNLNGAAFYYGTGGGAAAGNLYARKIYRALRNNGCIEVIETLHTSNIGNYEPGTVKEVDPAAVWQRLDQVVNSFKFTK
jgi:hypothetical protein